MDVRTGFTPWPDEVARRYRERGLWRGRTLGTEFRERAERTPDRVALIDGDERRTYRNLDDTADLLAARLLGRGLGRGDVVVVQLPNTAEFVILTLACLRIGVVPVMALTQHRQADIRHLFDITDARAYAVPTRYRDFDHLAMADEIAARTPSLRHVLVAGEATPPDRFRLAIREDGDPTTARSSIRPHTPAPDDPALLLLSGGTTGRPKLIARTHDDYALNARATADVCGITENTVYLIALPAAHNFALACPGILGVLFAGGTVVMSDSPAPDRAFALIERHAVTDTAVVPAVAHRWAEAARTTGYDLSSLRALAVGGSRLAPELARRVEPALGVRVQQGFGMAEGLINYTRLDDPDTVRHGTQGRPVCPDDEIRIVDPSDRDVPDGHTGELLTRGPYTIRGYYRAPEHNARAFTADGWYRTGDIVRLHPSGNLVVEGRVKDIINRGGEKISAEEIENFAYGHPAVSDAAAVPSPDPVLGEVICLYIVAKPDTEPSPEALREHMTRAGMAVHKLPDVIHVITRMPTTNVGKIDKAALRTDAARRQGHAIHP
ncbi:(2,3-dihydroxybenzoyl)adenylate synthase [Embleya hyalina]|uniref:2,3-dihydroxybenzoate-AMP ligase n=1 Tax=Embleya hyalina TaxID=516124 RepID=A0A401YR30_9ACTN|nr:AMP-binding protein [Embleya hyalina]GCD97015.1 2,3-dihydroxybenzoate-AMP ligase [Embleya hyalina]